MQVLIFPNSTLSWVPMAATVTMIATAIRPTIIPYSTAVAPSSSFAKVRIPLSSFFIGSFKLSYQTEGQNGLPYFRDLRLCKMLSNPAANNLRCLPKDTRTAERSG